MQKILLTFLLLFSTAQFCFAQDRPPQARLIDEFGSEYCESVLAKVDNFMAELQNDPSAIGYAIIHPRKGAHKTAFQREDWINSNIGFRHFPEDRLLVIRGEERDDLQVQFWLVPAGATKPGFTASKWTFFEKDLRKPFNFSEEFYDISKPGRNLDYYIDFLVDNPGTRGKIVIYNKRGRDARKESESILKMLTEERKITRNRLRVFYAKKENVLSNSEFWIVPDRRL